MIKKESEALAGLPAGDSLFSLYDVSMGRCLTVVPVLFLHPGKVGIAGFKNFLSCYEKRFSKDFRG